MKIIALTACHNRCNFTLAILDQLHKQNLPQGYSLSIVVVDDASSDGTADLIRDKFPDVFVIKGNGNLFWARALRFAWNSYLKSEFFDALLVFNDDIRLYENALIDLIVAYNKIKNLHGRSIAVSAAFFDQSKKQISYGGYINSSWWHPLRFKMVSPLDSIPLKIDTLNMNLALISKQALKVTGFLSEYFIHAGADMEFGLKLNKAGGSVWLCPGILGECSRHDEDHVYNEGNSLSSKLKFVTRIKGEPAVVRLKYFYYHGGILWPFLFVSLYVKIIFSHLYFILKNK
jgi:GT2 family glycosyltransferase